MRYWTVSVLLLGCLSCAAVKTEQSEMPLSPSALHNVSVVDQLTSDEILQNSARTHQNIYGTIYRINFGSQLVNVKTSVRETADSKTGISGDPASASVPRYFELRATSVLAGTSLVGDGEMSYSVLDSSADNMRPAMIRFGLTHRWRDLKYGADYKSVTKGFIPIAGLVADQPRDDALIWVEHGVGPFNLRGSIGESWERLTDTDLRVTRLAGATLQINRPRWGGSLTTSYGLIDQGVGANEESTVVINRLTTSYHPSNFLLLEPNFSIKDEWNQHSGVRTQTPASGFSITYTPPGNSFLLMGGTTFSRIFNSDGASDVSMHGTSAGVDWKIGKFLGPNDTLSFTFNYDRRLDRIFRANSQDGLSGMLQFKIAGF
jgi:hypothetical protein